MHGAPGDELALAAPHIAARTGLVTRRGALPHIEDARRSGDEDARHARPALARIVGIRRELVEPELAQPLQRPCCWGHPSEVRPVGDLHSPRAATSRSSRFARSSGVETANWMRRVADCSGFDRCYPFRFRPVLTLDQDDRRH